MKLTLIARETGQSTSDLLSTLLSAGVDQVSVSYLAGRPTIKCEADEGQVAALRFSHFVNWRFARAESAADAEDSPFRFDMAVGGGSLLDQIVNVHRASKFMGERVGELLRQAGVRDAGV